MNHNFNDSQEIQKPNPDRTWSERLNKASEITSAASNWIPGEGKIVAQTTSKLFGIGRDVAEHKENKDVEKEGKEKAVVNESGNIAGVLVNGEETEKKTNF